MLFHYNMRTPFRPRILRNVAFSIFLLRYLLLKSVYQSQPYSNQQVVQHTHYSPILLSFRYTIYLENRIRHTLFQCTQQAFH
nr:MAG TPA: hypothetical protein [Caudoviricetes sp.]